jgi:hypothetical protein
MLGCAAARKRCIALCHIGRQSPLYCCFATDARRYMQLLELLARVVCIDEFNVVSDTCIPVKSVPAILKGSSWYSSTSNNALASIV